MTNKHTLAGFGALIAVLAAALAMVAFTGTSSAQESETDAPDVTLAIAIGQLTEDDGETAFLDLHAIDKGGPRSRGNFRFWSEEYGYYNGGVRDLTCEDGVITAKGGGKLVQPDGTRVGVVYEAVFNTNDGTAAVTVHGRDGLEYTLEGALDGFTYCDNPFENPPTS